MTEHTNLSEASRLLQVSQKTLRRWDKEGKIKTIRTAGGHRRIPSSEIDRLQGIVAPERTVTLAGDKLQQRMVLESQRGLGLDAKRQIPWTMAEEAILKEHGDYLSSHELSALLPNHSSCAIGVKCRRLGIMKKASFRKRHGQLARSFVDPDNICKLDQSLQLADFDNIHIQVLLGSILGDGCLSPPRRNARNAMFREGHRHGQYEYVRWKAGMLQEFMPRFHGTNPDRPELVTASHPIFSRLYRDIYTEGDGHKRTIPLEVAENLDELGLLIWYLDDGNLDKRFPRICTKLFTRPNLDDTVAVISSSLDLPLTVREHKHKEGTCRTVYFPAASRDKIFPVWLRLAEKYELPEVMMYKLRIPPIKKKT